MDLTKKAAQSALLSIAVAALSYVFGAPKHDVFVNFVVWGPTLFIAWLGPMAVQDAITRSRKRHFDAKRNSRRSIFV